jgi:type I restriction enzyme M protein
MVPFSEVGNAANDFNLNIPRYIDSSEPADIQDLQAHLHGGIPERDIDALSASWDAFPSLRQHLFTGNGRDGYCELTVDISEVQQAILNSVEFNNFSEQESNEIAEWYAAHRPTMESINESTKPNDLIVQLGDDLLARFRETALLDEYDVYEQLMTYWHSVMHDDVFLVMNDGWLEAARPRKTIEDKDRKITETPDLVIGSGRGAVKYKMDLVPPSLIVNRYFAKDQTFIDGLTTVAEEAIRQIDEYTEEHAVDGGLLADAMDDGKITKALAAARLKDAKQEHADKEEINALEHLIKLYNGEAAARKLVKDTQAKLDTVTLAQYGKLTEDDVKTLVLVDKWQVAITSAILGEIHKLSHDLVSRIKELGERYDETVGDLESELEELSAKVSHHLAEMGVK